MNSSRKSKFIGIVIFFGLLLVYPVFIYSTQLKTTTQQQASENTCVGNKYYCSEKSCFDQNATFAPDKSCPQLYYRKQLHNQVCCKKQ